MLSVVILIRRHNESFVDLILKYKENKQQKLFDLHKKEMNIELEKT